MVLFLKNMPKKGYFMSNTLENTSQFEGLHFVRRGKVREIYDFQDKFLMIASDRISCFDVVLPTPIPRKGEILTQISAFWFDFIKDIIPNHLISANVDEFPKELAKYKEALRNRTMLVKKVKTIPVECVVRGYLSGSGWKEYKDTQSVCGIHLPAGLKESDKLPEPIFTPATKESVGHDMNVAFDDIKKEVGSDTANFLKETSLAIYKKASAFAAERGIIVADTKFEFGWLDEKIILIDEVLTPDSSRFWPKDQYNPGKAQPSFDKQYVRDYLLTLDWDKTYPGPKLPEKIVNHTVEKYLQAFKMLTGKVL